MKCERILTVVCSCLRTLSVSHATICAYCGTLEKRKFEIDIVLARDRRSTHGTQHAYSTVASSTTHSRVSHSTSRPNSRQTRASGSRSSRTDASLASHGGGG
eukprot:CAMPEP_0206158974 /NCGR_PEP_ID=MMETSP1474-20131121/5344_1 /ASSEMBLY_ACC=CAM_ASM_001110 /TAXON_ID=97495 /ORGANISM="Imantonia sp., Strain RCC918" /LENGTH=101 /DNA_ID=CAMNT_0053559357 /DNA_START=85 /DNA_END=386 /DNA_ORIENTATION=+